ncbi:hypothetical protein ACQWTT_001073 [Acinetobacter baumannii]
MTAIVLNQQIESMDKKVVRNKRTFLYLLPFVAVGMAYILGFKAFLIPILVASFIVSVVFDLALSGKDKETHGGTNFLKDVEANKEFEINDAKRHLKAVNAVIYRIDSKNHTIQFYVNEKKYSMLIKPKS